MIRLKIEITGDDETEAIRAVNALAKMMRESLSEKQELAPGYCIGAIGRQASCEVITEP